MDSPPKLSDRSAPEFQPRLTLDAVKTILWESAWNAFIRTFLVQIMGSIAIGMLEGVFSEMTPSVPPLGLKPSAEAHRPHSAHGLRVSVVENHFWVIFSVLFVAIAATRFVRYSRHPKHRTLAAALLKVHRRLTRHWFHLFVFNAFGAWISAMVIVFVQQFSWTQMLWNWVCSVMQPMFHALANSLPGGGAMARWYGWYGQNQTKLLFWLLYSAAICDDLGLPNYKTLLRWSLRRLKGFWRTRWGTSKTGSQVAVR